MAATVSYTHLDVYKRQGHPATVHRSVTRSIRNVAVHGVATLEDGQPALLAVASDGCTIGLYGGKSAVKVVRAASRIVRLTVSPFTSHFVYEDEGGPVSYTHLDVYKRQLAHCVRLGRKGFEWACFGPLRCARSHSSPLPNWLDVCARLWWSR